MNRFFIFDMDGVLIDSEPLHNQMMDLVFERLNLHFSTEYRASLTGMAGIPMWQKIASDRGLTQTPEELLKFHRELLFSELDDKSVPIVSGIKTLIERLIQQNYRLAVASSSEMNLIHYFLKKLKLFSFFDVIVSGENLPKSKPHPEIFIKTAELLGANPKNCIVLEDSKNGVTAAKNAGMFCIGFENPNSGNQDLSKSDWIVKNISEITIEKLEKIHF